MRNALLISLISLTAFATPPQPRSVPLAWTWTVNPADLGGMSTNDYLTNIVFSLYSVTNCTIPTNQWPVVTNWQASTFPVAADGGWTNVVVVDTSTRFYLLSVGGVNGSTSPFSNLAVLVATPQSGIIRRLGP